MEAFPFLDSHFNVRPFIGFRKSGTTMQTQLSRRIAALQPSATLAMAAKAKELKAAGRKVISLSLGEPDFNTPAHICDAAAKAMAE